MGQLSPDEWFNLAWKRQHEGRWQEALAAYEQALARGVEQPRKRISTAPSSSPRRWREATMPRASSMRRSTLNPALRRRPGSASAACTSSGAIAPRPATPTSRRSGSIRCSRWRWRAWPTCGRSPDPTIR